MVKRLRERGSDRPVTGRIRYLQSLTSFLYLHKAGTRLTKQFIFVLLLSQTDTWLPLHPGCPAPPFRASTQNDGTSSVTVHCLLSLCWLLRVENLGRYIFFRRLRTLPTQFTWHFRCFFFLFFFTLRHRCISYCEIYKRTLPDEGQYVTECLLFNIHPTTTISKQISNTSVQGDYQNNLLTRYPTDAWCLRS